jgi:hypothetical protein
MPHQILPRLRKRYRWRQEAVPVGHPHPEWVEKYPWPHLKNTITGRIFTKINNFI